MFAAFIVSTSHSGRSGMDRAVLHAYYTYLPLPRERSPYGTTTDSSGRHLIAAYYSFICPERMKG